MEALAAARSGLMAAERRFETAAVRIASAPADETVDLAHEVLEMIRARHHVSANLKVVRFASEMWRALLEVQVR